MRGNFWPIFLILVALGAAAIWKLTPRYVERLPEGMRAELRSMVQSALGAAERSRSEIAAARERLERKDEPVVLLGGTKSREGTAMSAAPAVPAAPNPALVAAPPPSAPVVPTVKVVSLAKADWCVMKVNAPIETLAENPCGTAAGGRFFKIERRARDPRGGNLLIGNFTPSRLPNTVQVNERYVLLLSGSPDDLSTAQAHALKMYYQLRGEAMAYLDELRRTGGDSASPYVKQLKEAERIRDFRARELEQMKTLAGDQRIVEENELEKLKYKAAVIRERHEAWKRANAKLLSDPTRDAHYQNLVNEYRRYAAAMPAGLAVD